MPGRESDYDRGFLRGVSAMMQLVASGDVKRLDKSNVLRYAQEVVQSLKEKDN